MLTELKNETAIGQTPRDIISTRYGANDEESDDGLAGLQSGWSCLDLDWFIARAMARRTPPENINVHKIPALGL
jgi:hypothetical protein